MIVLITYVQTKDCTDLNIAIYQKIERLGFHREINWLIEPHYIDYELWDESSCQLALMLDVLPEMYVDPDQIDDLRRLRKLNAIINGDVNIELPAHQALKHKVYIYLNHSNSNDKLIVTLPIHLRYQKSHFGGFGKAYLNKVNLLVTCIKSTYNICNTVTTIIGPKNLNEMETAPWSNISYISDFDVVELLVPIGDLNHYPLVAIVTCVLGCVGCIYLLSIITNNKHLNN
ncbi:hypothetical protein GWI33_005717 [Rhynchophorus ferrugineus]|uniref:Phosphatidylinositol-glycan biosynthesis class X protein n=1 Tax=Rhynchophorus ferrugineus TaxID=354439 RepID=A0A834MHT3_RHYFE|nr:hypothetical protein GWI33_005717 [Rhynchophorus ferrugineus]